VNVRAVTFVCLSLLPFLTLQESVAAPSEEAAKRLVWQSAIQQSVPREPGCYEAKKYPAQEWTKVPCGTAPLQQERVPAMQARPSNTLPGGNDFTLSVPAGTLTSVTGSIQDIQNFSTETGGTDSYSLQVNSNYFTPAICGSNTGCYGWEQFVFMNDEGQGQLGIEAWLFNDSTGTPPACPLPFLGSPPNCHAGPVSFTFPEEPFADLKGTTMTATADPNGEDKVVVTFDASSSPPPMAVVGDSTLSLAAHWQTAQFNVFGEGNGAVAMFNPGALVKVSVRGTPSQAGATPTCTLTGQSTGENSNLALLPPCASDNAAVPTFTFQEASAPQLTDMSPTVSLPSGGTIITLSGEGMTSSTVVAAGNAMTSCVGTGSPCHFSSPPGAGSIGVSVANHYPSTSSGQGNVLGPFSNQLYLAFQNPPRICTSCPGEKCCRNPDGGPGIICVPNALNCPNLH
jgi:hypothetical protein